MHAASAPAPTRLSEAARRTGRLVGRLDVLTARIPPWAVLGPLVVCTWLVMLAVAMAAKHSGWLYYESGDGTWYYTSAWVLGHGHVPYGSIGYGYSLLVAPLAAIGGPNMLVGLPLIIVFNAVVLAPIALLCIYGLTKAIGGRRFAYIGSALWVAMPLLAIPYFDPRYHGRYIDQTLPSVLGLTVLGDYPSMVLFLVAAFFTFRALARRSDFDALAAGLAAGFALAVKPANALFLPAPLLALAFSKRFREAGILTAGLVPALLGLALWKFRGLGYVPAFSGPTATLAAGHASPLPAGSVGLQISHYLHFNWGNLTRNIDGFREYGWSLRLLEWGLLAGLIGLARRSISAALLVGSWLTIFLLVKGSAGIADLRAGGFFRYMSPAFPAVFLLLISIPMLLPIAGRKLARSGDAAGWPETRRSRRTALTVGAAAGTLPLLFLAFPVLTSATATRVPILGFYTPSDQFPVSGRVTDGLVTLHWPRARTRGTTVAYGVYRYTTDPLQCSLQRHSAIDCQLMTPFAAYTSANLVTEVPGPGDWVYRVSVLAAPYGPAQGGDTMLISKPFTVHVPG
jgi:hypothetical protein